MMASDYDLIPLAHRGIRTKKLKALLLEHLADRDPGDVEAKIEAALGAAGLKIKEDGKTEYLLFLGEGEIAAFASLIAAHWDELPIGSDKKSKKDAKVRFAIRTGQEGEGVARRGKSRRHRTVRPNAG